MEVPGREKAFSAPFLSGIGEESNEQDVRQMYSLSLSKLRNDPDLKIFTQKPAPFTLRWLHGYSSKPGVINLNRESSTVAFYAASNCGVLYNWTNNTMKILQGHRHMVTCIAADLSGRWLVTADSGPDNVLIVWDARDCFPQRTLFSPHGGARTARVAISADAKYLLSLAYEEHTVVNWWIWAFGVPLPHAKISVTSLVKESVLKMEFNPFDSTQFLLLTKMDIWIGRSGKIFVMERGVLKETNEYELKVRRVEKKLRGDYGRLTCFTFVEATSQVLVATSRGAVFVYGYTIDYQQGAKAAGFEQLRFVKPLKVELHKILVIKSVDNVIVTGNKAGEIHFYDEQVKLLYWVHKFHVDCVQGLSFNLQPRSYMILEGNAYCACRERVLTVVDETTGKLVQTLVKEQLPSDATTGGRPFLVRDFIVWTNNDGVGFVDFAAEDFQKIMNTRTSIALSLSVHPEKPTLVIGYADGSIEMLNFVNHSLFLRIDLRDRYKIVTPPKDDSINCDYEVSIPEISVSCLKHSPSGLHLACGLNSGQLLFLEPTTLNIVTEPPFSDTTHEIQEINYSIDSLTLACADVSKCVLVYKYNCDTFNWAFLGKHRAHYHDIATVFFLPEKYQGEYKLLSIGTDRIMVEYDLSASADEYLELVSVDRVEQTAVPLGAVLWPAPPRLDPQLCRMDLPCILIANDEHKYKILNYETTMTLSTVLGPRYRDPVRRMQLVSKQVDGETRQYLLFATKDMIGLQKLPLDGNPWKHVGMLGHPIEVKEMCYREDLGILFTIGSKDSSLTQWSANYTSPDVATTMGGTEIDPYYCLIENGRPGWLFQEIRDLFYYVQILCQGTFSPAMRRVKDYIPIDSLPDLMRALGYFPSEYEVENLIVEAQYKVYQKTPVTEIDFEEFVQLYLNHRPAFGDCFQKLKAAFRTFATTRRDEVFMNRKNFIDVLVKHGECFSSELIWYLVSILCGQSFEDRAAMSPNDFSFLPEKITFSTLVSTVLGIPEAEEEPDRTSHYSYYSQPASTLDSYP